MLGGMVIEATASQPYDDRVDRLVAELHGRVIVALDHLTEAERVAVRAAVQAFARQQMEGKRLPDPEPLFLLRAAPEVLVIVRREPGLPVVVEDVVRPATWRRLADA